MTDLVLPDLAFRQVGFVPDDETVRGDETPGSPAAEVAASLASRVRIGGPIAVPVTADLVRDEDDLKVFVVAESGAHMFYLMHLAATFTSGPDDPAFESATIELLLSNTGAAPDGGEPPVAWSMLPQRLADDATHETTWQFGPELTLEGVGGLKVGSVEHTTTRVVAEVAVEALGLLRPDPAWRIRATPRRPVDGAYRFVLVVRTPHNTAVHVSVAMRAVVRKRGLLRYRSIAQPPIVLGTEL